MALQISCPACAASFITADDLRGKKAFCPRCGQTLVITAGGVAKRKEGDFPLPLEGAAGTGAGVTKRTPVPAGVPTAVPAPRPCRSMAKLAPRRKRWLWPALLLLVLAAAAIVTWLVLHRSERSHEHGGRPPTDPKVEIRVDEVPDGERVVPVGRSSAAVPVAAAWSRRAGTTPPSASAFASAWRRGTAASDAR